jgi:hypothetical protein
MRPPGDSEPMAGPAAGGSDRHGHCDRRGAAAQRLRLLAAAPEPTGQNQAHPSPPPQDQLAAPLHNAASARHSLSAPHCDAAATAAAAAPPGFPVGPSSPHGSLLAAAAAAAGRADSRCVCHVATAAHLAPVCHESERRSVLRHPIRTAAAAAAVSGWGCWASRFCTSLQSSRRRRLPAVAGRAENPVEPAGLSCGCRRCGDSEES